MLLAGRSSVFRRMFAADTQEAKQNRISTEDFDADAVEQLIRYIHTGSINESLGVSARNLLEIALEFQVAGLKTLAKEQLAAENTVETVCETLEFAMLSDDSENLREECFKFIQANMNEVQAAGKLYTLGEAAKAKLFDYIFTQK